jgi:hypothetical protein
LTSTGPWEETFTLPNLSAFEAERLVIKNEKAIKLNLSPELAWRPPIGDILSRFIKSPETASNVRSISFSNDWQKRLPKHLRLRKERTFAEGSTSEMASDSSITPEKMTQQISAWSPRARMSTILELLPNVQVLKIQQGYGKLDFLDVFRLSKSGPVMPAALQNLTEISLTWKPAKDLSMTSRRRIGPLDLLPLFLLPKIQSLYLNLPLSLGDTVLSLTTEEQIDEAFAPHIGKSTLKKLILDQQSIDFSFFRDLLRLPSALEHFTYTPKDGQQPNALPEAANAIAVQRRTLLTVDLKICPADRVASSMISFEENYWTKFSALQHLSVPLEALIIAPWQAPVRNVRDDDCLNRAFPKGIKSLRFYLFEEWHAYCYRCMTWRRIVNSIRKNAYPELKTIWVGVWDFQCLMCGVINWPIWKPGWKKTNVKVDVKHFVWKPNRPWPFTVWRGENAVGESLAIYLVFWVIWDLLYQLGFLSRRPCLFCAGGLVG